MHRLRNLFAFLAVAFLAFFAVASYAFEGMQRLSLWVAIPAATIFSFLTYPQLKFNIYMKLQFALYLWIAFTALFAQFPLIAGSQVRRIVVCFMSIYCFNQLAMKQGMVKWLYAVYIIFYLGMLYYAGTHILDADFDYTEDRLDDNKLNANMIAYFTFFTTYIVFLMAEIVKTKLIRFVFLILFLLSPAWSFAAAILTGSRQIIVIQVPLIVILFYLRYLKNQSPIRKVLFVSASIVAGVILIQKGLSIYEDSYLNQRNEDSYMEDSRSKLIMDALEVGITHPLVGVGPGCFGKFKYGRSFSHCNYVELFANSGLLAMALCIAMYWIFIRTQWKRYKRTKDRVILAFFVFGLMYALDNVFYVYYTNPWLMSFFFLVAMHSDNYYQENHSINRPVTQIALGAHNEEINHS